MLFAGNDTGVFVSIDRGARWVKMNGTMPDIPVHDMLVHPRDNDLIVGTYGRGIFVTNIEPLQQMTAATLAEDVHLFDTAPVVQRVIWSYGANDYLFGQRQLQTPNAPNGMVIRYYLKDAAPAAALVTIADANGQEVARLEGRATAGINTVVWTTRRGGAGRRGSGPPAANPLDQWMPLGDYAVTLAVAGKTLTQHAQIAKTQGWSIGAAPQIIR